MSPGRDKCVEIDKYEVFLSQQQEQNNPAIWQ